MNGSEQQERIQLVVNGRSYDRMVPVRRTLADFIREDLGLTGTHLGCEHGVCGACSVLIDGNLVRSCLMLAVTAREKTIETIESVGSPDELHPVQKAFRDRHGLQCGFCTPGMVLAAIAMLRETPNPSTDEIRAWMAGNLCRCTGYQFIVDAIAQAAGDMTDTTSSDTTANAATT